MTDIHSDVVAALQSAVERAKPAGAELTYHPIVSDRPDGSSFTTVHVVTADGTPVEASFDFAAVARELGKKAHPKVEDRKIYGQRMPLPYKVITGATGNQPFEILFMLNELA
jgi:hypothetical protein